ncbi:MAG: hypothetical protein AAFY36_18370 [Bacteroidota bacterium]
MRRLFDISFGNEIYRASFAYDVFPLYSCCTLHGYDLLGRNIFSKSVSGTDGINNKVVQISIEQNGIFNLIFEPNDSKGQILSERIIVHE